MRKKMKQHSSVVIALMVSFVLATGSPNFAQSVADAARQERERKRALGLHPPHVYTNEDLSKPRILVPEDEARVEAKIKESNDTVTATTANAAAPATAADGPAEPVEVPDIKDFADAPALPASMDAPANVMLPVDVSKTPPQVTNRSFRDGYAAPVIVGQEPVGPVVTTTSANIMIPAAASEPVTKPSVNLTQPQHPAVIAGISIPATTMPFATELGYGTASIPMPAAASNVFAKGSARRVVNPAPVTEVAMPSVTMPFATPPAYVPPYIDASATATPALTRKSTREAVSIGAPVITPAVAAAPPRLTLTEHSIVRPEAMPVSSTKPAACAATCAPQPMSAASEVMVRADVRPDIAKAVPGANAAVLKSSPAPESGDSITVKVRVAPGDSLWKLAERYFGNGLRWKRLAALNPQLADPNHILAGDWIQIPADHKQSAKHFIIQPGDTLWKVARAELGSPLALGCLAHANPQLQSVDIVQAGETLVVPPACGDLDKSQN
jgi:nucleoid-associated protein YgaU